MKRVETDQRLYAASTALLEDCLAASASYNPRDLNL